jgi:hypothetical protein
VDRDTIRLLKNPSCTGCGSKDVVKKTKIEYRSLGPSLCGQSSRRYSYWKCHVCGTTFLRKCVDLE